MVVGHASKLKTLSLQIRSKVLLLFSFPRNMPEENALFYLLDSVDSTNNYAMANVHAGLASHGMAWFANEQTHGKGQRSKGWQAEPGKNIILSIALNPPAVFRAQPFNLSCLVAVACAEFLQKNSNQEISIKWPNDIYWRDRKAGGILIENVFSGSEWKWAVVGTGININQTQFGAGLSSPVSLQEIAGKEFNPEVLARQLHQYILDKVNGSTEESMKLLLLAYNDRLFKKGEQVKLKKDSAVFQTTVRGVNETGQLVTEDTMERIFDYGTVEWIFS